MPQLRLSLAGEERADLRGGVRFKGGDRPLGDHMAAPGARLRPHFYDPVGLLQNLRVVIDQDDGVAVGHQIVHYAGQSNNIGGCRPMEGSSST